MKYHIPALIPSVCCALAATVLPGIAQAQTNGGDVLQTTLTFDNPDVFNHNFYTTTSLTFNVNPTSGVVVAPGGSVNRLTVYSTGNGAAPTGYKNNLDAFYNGSISTTFSMNFNFAQDSASIQTIARVQDNGLGIIGLTNIDLSSTGKIRFGFGVINLETNVVSNSFGNTAVIEWAGSAAQVPAGTKLRVVMEANDISFQLSLQNLDGDVLASSGWHSMSEAIASEFNSVGGVGLRTGWSKTDNSYTFYEFGFTPAIPEPAYVSLLAAAAAIAAVTCVHRLRRR